MTEPLIVLESDSVEMTRQIGMKLVTVLTKGDVVILKGDLGAGKTQFVKGVAEALDVKDNVVSPTFIIAVVYRGRTDLIHIDAYRLESLYEVADLGLDEDFTQAITFVEWGDRVVDFMDNVVMTVEIDQGKLENFRNLRIYCFDDHKATLVKKLFN